MATLKHVTLQHNAYGKTNVRLVKVRRTQNQHDLFDVSVDITLEGDLADTFLDGDNRKVVATDTMKNTVYALGKRHDFGSVEMFGRRLAEHFLTEHDHLTKATIDLRERLWSRIVVNDTPHSHAFEGSSRELRTAKVSHTRDKTTVQGGIKSLPLLKTTGSAFSDFVKDEFTTLKDASDRPFGTNLTATWTYSADPPDYSATHMTLRATLLETFARHDESQSVQQTLYLMGTKALEATGAVSGIYLSMPNEHRLLVDLAPFGMDNPNEIFVPVDEPSGMIEATLTRG